MKMQCRFTPDLNYNHFICLNISNIYFKTAIYLIISTVFSEPETPKTYPTVKIINLRKPADATGRY